MRRRQGSVPATGARSGGQEATGEVPRGTHRGWARARAARSNGANTDGAPRPAAAEGDRARAADDATEDKERGRRPGHGKGAQGREQGAQASGHRAHGAERGTVGERRRSQGHGHGHGTGTGVGSTGQGVGDRGTDRGTEAWGPATDPRARARAPWAPGDRQDGAWEPGAAGGTKGGGGGRGAPAA